MPDARYATPEMQQNTSKESYSNRTNMPKWYTHAKKDANYEKASLFAEKLISISFSKLVISKLRLSLSRPSVRSS